MSLAILVVGWIMIILLLVYLAVNIDKTSYWVYEFESTDCVEEQSKTITHKTINKNAKKVGIKFRKNRRRAAIAIKKQEIM